jgi:hypothetical protein
VDTLVTRILPPRGGKQFEVPKIVRDPTSGRPDAFKTLAALEPINRAARELFWIPFPEFLDEVRTSWRRLHIFMYSSEFNGGGSTSLSVVAQRLRTRLDEINAEIPYAFHGRETNWEPEHLRCRMAWKTHTVYVYYPPHRRLLTTSGILPQISKSTSTGRLKLSFSRGFVRLVSSNV